MGAERPALGPQPGASVEVAVFVEGGTAVLVPACFLPCPAVHLDYPGARWVATRLNQGVYVAVPLASAILLLHELVSLPGVQPAPG